MDDRDLTRYASWHKTRNAGSSKRLRALSSSSSDAESIDDAAPGMENQGDEQSSTDDYVMESVESSSYDGFHSASPPSSPSPQPSENPDTGDEDESFWNDMDNEMLFFMAINLKKGKSRKDTEELFSCADYIYKQGEKRFTHAEYNQILKYVAQELCHTTVHFCASCGTPLPHQNSLCYNARCKDRQKRWRRNRNRKKNTVDILHMRTYFQNFFEHCIEELLLAHQEAHQADPNSRDDIRFSPKFREAMESPRAFNEGNLTVQIGLNTDGFQFKGLERGQSFPFLLPVLSLPQHMRQRMQYMPFPIIATAGKKLHTRAMDYIASKLSGFLRSTQDDPIIVSSSRGNIAIKVNVLLAMLDFKASNELFLMKGWQAMFGCYQCLLPGVRDGNKYCWPALRNALPRNEDKGALNSVYSHAQRAIFGFKGYSRFLDIITPNRLAPDVLHLLSEGLLCDTINECNVAGLKMSATRRGRIVIQELSNSCHNSTSNRTQTLHTDDKGIITGGEREQGQFVAQGLFPYNGLLLSNPVQHDEIFISTYSIMSLIPHTLEDMFAAPHFLFLAFLIRSIESYTLDTDIIAMLKHVTHLYLEYHSEKFGLQYATMKHHWLEHLLQHMEEFGSPMCTTNAPHEASYRLMKMQSTPGNTRGYASAVLKRSSTLLMTKLEINRRASRGDQQCAAFATSLDKFTGKTRFMCQSTPLPGIEGGFYSSKDVVPNNSPIYGRLKRLLPRNGTRFFKRMGRDNYGFAGTPFVKNKQETQRTCVIIADEQGGCYHFAKVFAFAITNNGVKAIVDRFETWNAIEVLTEFLEDHPQKNTTANMKGFALMQQLAIVNQFFYEYDNDDHTRLIVPFESIVAPANITSAQGRTFAINMANRVYHE